MKKFRKRHPRLHRWRQLVEYVAFRGVVCVVDLLPLRASIRMAETLAFVIRLLPKKLTRSDVARENIRTAFGDRFNDAEIDDIIHRMWIHLFRIIVEIVQVRRKLRLSNCADVVQFSGRDEMVRLLCSGRPVIFVGGHFGNWEIAIGTLGMFGFPMGVIARDLDNPYLHRWFERFREQTGHRLISKNGGGADMLAVLERRGHLALLGDQDAGSTGLFVDFFGRPASTFKSIALLALQYRAYIVVGYAIRLPENFEQNRWLRYEIGNADVIDTDDHSGPGAVREVTQRFTTALETAIRRARSSISGSTAGGKAFRVHECDANEPPDDRRGRLPSFARASPLPLERTRVWSARFMAEWHRVADVNELAEGTGRELAAGGRVVALFHVAGVFYAMDGICPHSGGPLGEGMLRGCVVTCPWHGWQFDVTTGRHALNPRIEHATFATKVVGADVFVEIP